MPSSQRGDAGRIPDEMTINVALATSDALVIGCDSIASTVSYYVDPIRLQELKKQPLTPDESGKYTIEFTGEDIEPVVTNAWGGVTKMFEISPQPSPVVAVTAGLAKLNDLPIASIAQEFCEAQKRRRAPQVKVQTICNSFLRFMRARYEDHYNESAIPEQFREGPLFLVGGFGRNDKFPSIYRVNIQENSARLAFENGRTGVAWEGQSDAVERFIRGYDRDARSDLRDKFAETLKSHSETLTLHFTDLINQILDRIGAKMPEDIEFKVPSPPPITINWRQYRVPLSYSNLPLQDAINFVSFLVMIQAGKSRFSIGVPTVGGRTHIGVVTRDKGFQLLNEPPLQHRYTGFSDDP
ncbi:MAG TPA: hypothetical protein VM755_08325 [Stellaceae bacterium]|nr:hypothetical protein [Stellaceae bacterium]